MSIWKCKVPCDVSANELSRLEHYFQFNKIKKENLQLALCLSGVILSSTNPKELGTCWQEGNHYTADCFSIVAQVHSFLKVVFQWESRVLMQRAPVQLAAEANK